MTAHGLGDLQTVSALALNAGLDMDMVGEGFLTTLKKSLKEGKVIAAKHRRCLPPRAGSQVQTGFVRQSLQDNG